MVNHPPSPIIPRVKSRGLTGGAGAEGNGFLEMLRKHGGCHELSWGFNSLTPVCHFWGFNSLTPAAENTELELEFGQKKTSLYLTHQLHHAKSNNLSTSHWLLVNIGYPWDIRMNRSRPGGWRRGTSAPMPARLDHLSGKQLMKHVVWCCMSCSAILRTKKHIHGMFLVFLRMAETWKGQFLFNICLAVWYLPNQVGWCSFLVYPSW